MHSDASFSGWGGCLNLPGQPAIESRGLWLFNALESLLFNTNNVRIDTFVDNKALLHSSGRQVSKSSSIYDILKDIFSFTMSRRSSLNLMYVPSKVNPVDAPSRYLSDLDCSLSPIPWHQVDTAFGPQTIDLMALPFNVQADRASRPLRFFAPLPCAQALGINVFAQDISSDENAYVFPPFVLIGPLLKYLRSQQCTFSIVVPDLWPRKFWWPLVQQSASSSFKLGSKGDASIFLFPTQSGPTMFQPRPLQWDLWVFQVPSLPTVHECFSLQFYLAQFFVTPQTFSDGPPLTCNCRCVNQEKAALGDTVSSKNFSKQTHYPPQKHKASLYFQEERERSWWRYWKLLLQEREFVRNSTVPNMAFHPHI